MLEKEKLVRSERIFEGRIINVKVDTVTVQNGHETTRELVEHPGGVGIVAVTPDDRVCMVRQYRRPFDEITFEIPAGKLNWGEDPYECAVRELREETGFAAHSFQYLGAHYPTPGFCNERIHIYLATGLTAGEMNPDEDEFLEVEYHSFECLTRMILDNEIKDAKTVIGILKAKLVLGK